MGREPLLRGPPRPLWRHRSIKFDVYTGVRPASHARLNPGQVCEQSGGGVADPPSADTQWLRRARRIRTCSSTTDSVYAIVQQRCGPAALHMPNENGSKRVRADAGSWLRRYVRNRNGGVIGRGGGRGGAEPDDLASPGGGLRASRRPPPNRTRTRSCAEKNGWVSESFFWNRLKFSGPSNADDLGRKTTSHASLRGHRCGSWGGTVPRE